MLRQQYGKHDQHSASADKPTGAQAALSTFTASYHANMHDSDIRGLARDDALLTYAHNGFVAIPELFDLHEVAIVEPDFHRASAAQSPKVIRETSGEIRSVFLEPGDAPAVDIFIRQRRLLAMAEAILGSRVYAYQVKINSKRALSDDVWPWHQDYVFWREKDGLPNPRILTAAVMLDDVTEFSGPMYFVPGSHLAGLLPSRRRESLPGDYSSDLARYLSFELTKEVLAPLVQRQGMVSVTGKAGTVVFFHGCIAHGSSNNLAPFDRKMLFITYCSVDNVPAQAPRLRPNFLSNRDPSALEPQDAYAFTARR